MLDKPEDILVAIPQIEFQFLKQLSEQTNSQKNCEEKNNSAENLQSEDTKPQTEVKETPEIVNICPTEEVTKSDEQGALQVNYIVLIVSELCKLLIYLFYISRAPKVFIQKDCVMPKTRKRGRKKKKGRMKKTSRRTISKRRHVRKRYYRRRRRH